jgi:hypothetical protein
MIADAVSQTMQSFFDHQRVVRPTSRAADQDLHGDRLHAIVTKGEHRWASEMGFKHRFGIGLLHEDLQHIRVAAHRNSSALVR